MSCPVRSSMPLRLSRLRFSLVVLAAVALLLPTAGRAQTFSNSGSITIPSGFGSTTPTSGQYPTSGTCTNAACINVSGLSGSYTSMSINLSFSNMNSQSLASIALLLESPDGTHMLDILSFVCGGGPVSGSFALEDSSSNGLFPQNNCPGSFASNYLATHYDAGVADNFPSPGPNSSGYSIAGNGTNTTGTGTFSNTFGSLTGGSANASGSLNGTWRLYAVDQGDASSNTLITGWSLTFVVTGANDPTKTTLNASSPNPSFTSGSGDSVVFTAGVKDTNTNGPATTGSVTLWDGTTNSSLSTQNVDSSGNATFSNIVFSAEGDHDVYAVYNGGPGFAASGDSNTVVQTAINHATNPSGTTYCNGPVTLGNDTSGSPYPSRIVLGPTNIAGDTEPVVSGTIESVTVSVNGINLTNNAELDHLGLLLQAPGSNTTDLSSSGNAFEFLSWAGNPFTTGSLTFSDTGSSEIPYDTSPPCSTCLATDNWVDIGSSNSDSFPSPAPASFDKAAPTGSSTFASEFGGLGADGTWSLYADDRVTVSGSPGSINQWCLNFTMQVGANPTTTTVSGSPNPASFSTGTTASVTLTATVTSTGGTVNAGTVTFDDGSTQLGTAAVVNGTASITVNLNEGTHQILASYGGTNSGTVFGISSGKFDERVNKATTIAWTGSAYAYCNSGAIVAPGLGEDSGAAYPYPSNIFVTNLPGTVGTTTLSLNGFNTKDQGDLMSLLVGPTTSGNQWNNNFDFFSLTGSSVSSPSTSNLIFSDAGSSITTNLESSGTYAPTSNENLTFPQCGQNASDCGTENVGPPLGTGSTFTPTNKAQPQGASTFSGLFSGNSGNGTWSLYLDDGGPLGGGETTNVTNGWCVNLTPTPVNITPSLGHSGTGISGAFVQGETNASITVGVQNNGTGTAGDPAGGNANPLTVSDTLPTGLTYASASGTDWSCSATGQTVTCTNDEASVAQGSSYPTLTIDVNVSGSAPGSVSNSISVSGADVSPASTNDSITVDPPPSLGVGVGHTGTFTQGGTAQWNITVSNVAASNSITSGTVTVSDTLPSGTNGGTYAYTLNSFSGTGWSCSGTTTVTCTSSQGVTGGSSLTTLNLTVNIPANSPTSVSNTAGAYGGGDQVHTSLGTAIAATDSNVPVAQVPANIAIAGGNNQSAQVMAAFSNPLTVTVTDAGNVVIPSQSVTFAAPGTGASGIFSNSSTTITANTDASGQVSEAFTANSAPGVYGVTATVGTLPAATFSLTNVAITPTFTWTPVSTIIAGDAGANVLNATVNCVSCGNITYQWTPSGGGTPTTIATTSGLAAGSYTITANFNSTSISYNNTSTTASLTVNGESVWVVNSGGSTAELAGNGYGITSSAYSSGNVAGAIDSIGNLWTVGTGTNLLQDISQTGISQNALTSGGGLDSPSAVAIDGNSQIWVANSGNNSVTLFLNGSPESPTTGFTDSSLSTPSGVAVDLGGSVWIANQGNNSITRFLGAAAPAAPPSTAAKNSTTGVKP